jgi:biopolymer transport protein ExbD
MELQRGLSSDEIRSALLRGDLRDDDLVRPAGTTVPWSRLAEIPELVAPLAAEPNAPSAPTSGPQSEARRQTSEQLPDFEEVQPRLEEIVPPLTTRQPTTLPEASSSSDVAFPVFEEEVKPQPPEPSRPKTAPPPSSAWIWADEDDDDDEDRVVEDLGDLEILADESAADEPESIPIAGEEAPQAGLAPARDHPIDPASQKPVRSDESKKAGRWDLSQDDMNLDERPESRSSHIALPVVASRDRTESVSFEDEGDDPDASFSLSRAGTLKVEELDMAPMVDVALQLVLFFMVTAQTVLFKTLEIPKPSGDAPPSAVAQGRSRTLDELKDDFILLEIDDEGAMKLDREPIEPVMETLVEQLRRAREKTGRKTMLLAAGYGTLHRNAVLAYDAANEIGLGISVAKPNAPQGPAPTLRGAPTAVPKPAAAAPGPASS